MSAAHGQGGKTPTKWARFGKIPVGYKTIRVPGQSVSGHWAPAHTVRNVVYSNGGWLKVGSARYKRAISYVGPHGHQASIPMQFVHSKVRPGPTVGSPDSADRNAWAKTYNATIKAGGSKSQATQRANQQHGSSASNHSVVAGVGPSGGGKSGGPSKGAKATAQANTKTISGGIGGANVQKLQGPGAAAAMANLQFGSQIADNKLQQGMQQRQGAQDMADITNWYAQLAHQNAQGLAQNQAAVAQGTAATQNMTAKLLQGIGGSANSSSGTVAAAGDAAGANLQQLGVLQQMFASNRGSADTAAQAGQLSAQSALNSQNMLGLQSALRDLQGQRGNAIVANQASILAANNAARQANFGNRISKLQAVIGGQQAMGNMRLQGEQIIAAHNQNVYNQKTHNTQNGYGTDGFKPWAQLTANDKYGLVQQLMAPNAAGKVPTYQVALARAHALGYAPSNVSQYLGSYYGQ